MPIAKHKDLSENLLAWYDRHKRRLPWRDMAGDMKGNRAGAGGQKAPDPYRVWLAEIMLQQTTVATVVPYFQSFTAKWPTLQSLACARDEAVMAAWAGLGYYSRARNLLKCARLVVEEMGGQFPTSEKALLKLPGIGPYTAAAIAAIAFNQRTAPVDGNIERVLARLFAITSAPPALKAKVKAANQALVANMQAERAGDLAQAMMDLGAQICTAQRPKCLLCAWQNACQAHKKGMVDKLPRRAAKKARPTRKGLVYWLENRKGEILMCRRPDKGLLGGMLMFPSTGWDEKNETRLADILPAGWVMLEGEVVHIFTHFRLVLKIQKRKTPKGFRLTPALKKQNYCWIHPRHFPDEALPSVMRKVVALVD